MTSRPKTIDEAADRWGLRPEPLQEIVTYYDNDFSVHPDQIRVSFSDGSTAVYDIRRDQPHPVIMENIRIIRKWNGYINQPLARRRRRG